MTCASGSGQAGVPHLRKDLRSQGYARTLDRALSFSFLDEKSKNWRVGARQSQDLTQTIFIKEVRSIELMRGVSV